MIREVVRREEEWRGERRAVKREELGGEEGYIGEERHTPLNDSYLQRQQFYFHSGIFHKSSSPQQ